MADVEQRKSNEMIGAELGYRYVGLARSSAMSPAVPSTAFASTFRRRGLVRGCRTCGSTTEQPCTIRCDDAYVLLRLGRTADDTSALEARCAERRAPLQVLTIDDDARATSTDTI